MIAPLLKSIELQQNVGLKNEVGVVIANDGMDGRLLEDFLNSFPFDVQYIKCEHKGVSGTRNACLDAATVDYVMFYDAYYTMNKEERINQENKEYRNNTELRFKQYYQDFKMLFESIPKEIRSQSIVGMKNRFFAEWMLLESVTFDDWIKHIEAL